MKCTLAEGAAIDVCRAGAVRLLTLGHRHFLAKPKVKVVTAQPCTHSFLSPPPSTLLSCDRILDILFRSAIACRQPCLPHRAAAAPAIIKPPCPCAPFARPPTPSPKSRPLIRHSCHLLKLTAMGRVLSTCPHRHHSTSCPARPSRHAQRLCSSLPFMARRCWDSCSIP